MSLLRGVLVRLREVSGVVVLIVVWQAATLLFGVPGFLLPPPTAVARALLDGLPQIAEATGRTSVEAALGFVGGNVLGLLLAVGSARWRIFQEIGLPVAVALRSVPLVAITPVLTIVFGFGPLTIVLMAILISFFPALVAGTVGLRAPSGEALALMRVLDAPAPVVYRRLRIPAALPYVFAAFKISAPASVLAAMVAEWTAANSGLGYLILDAGGRYRFAFMWAGIVTATALAVLAFALASIAERRVIRWPVETS